MNKFTIVICVLSFILFSCENSGKEKHSKKKERTIIIVPHETELTQPLESAEEGEKIDFQEEFERIKKEGNERSENEE